MVGNAVETMVESSAASSSTSNSPLNATSTWRCFRGAGVPNGTEATGGATRGSVIGVRFYARWNDARFVRLGERSDEQFLAELLELLRTQLDSLREVPRVIAAVHHLPFRELLPPPRNAQWDFAKAFLGSPRLGELLLAYSNVTDVYCGHSHSPAEATIGQVHAVNIGSGYRAKTFKAVEL